MIIEVTLKDDQGNIIAPVVFGKAEQPLQWKTPNNNPFIIDRGVNETGTSNGVYKFWGFTVTPMIQLELQYRRQI